MDKIEQALGVLADAIRYEMKSPSRSDVWVAELRQALATLRAELAGLRRDNEAWVGNHNAVCEALDCVGYSEFEAIENIKLVNESGLAAADAAYLALLNAGNGIRIHHQRELCLLRDFIAKATNRKSEAVQDDYEERALIARAALDRARSATHPEQTP